MKSLIANLGEFHSTTHEAVELYVEDFLDDDLVDAFRESAQIEPGDRSKEQLIDDNLVLVKMLSQLGLTDDQQARLVFILPKKGIAPPVVKKGSKKPQAVFGGNGIQKQYHVFH